MGELAWVFNCANRAPRDRKIPVPFWSEGSDLIWAKSRAISVRVFYCEILFTGLVNGVFRLSSDTAKSKPPFAGAWRRGLVARANFSVITQA